MCGIAGVWNLDARPVTRAVLERMTRSLTHRGPDGEGYYIDGALGLGHRRLAVIDLSTAASQPMVTERTRCALSYNGEVYNFRELRRDLEALGHAFKSRGDSEVVLHALSTWGEDAVPRFNGMFAFAWWNGPRNELLLARDRYGIKPLYFTRRGDTIIFASEIRAILEHPLYRRDIDPTALLEYFTFQNIFTDRTLFKDITLVPPGSTVRFSLRSPDGYRRRYWDYDFREPEHPAPGGEYLEEVDRLFRQAVTRQLVSDVDIGAYLSGGMDSGSITAVAARALPYMKSFTVGFDLHSVSGMELAYDEREKAEFMSYLFKTEHYEMVLKAGDMERALPALTRSIEDPRVGQCYPNFYAAQLAGKFVKVVLSGAGGDELFGGYPWRYYRGVINDDFEHYVDKYFRFWQRLLPPESVERVFAPLWPAVKDVSTRDIFRGVFAEHAETLTRPEDYINHSLYFEAKTFLHGLLLVDDRVSMAHGLEARVPFLDNDLVDLAMRIPARLKLGHLEDVVRLNENDPGPKTARYFERTRDGKLILRKAMAAYIPAEVTERIKQGFSAPDATWFKGESIEYVKRRLFAPDARLYQFLDRTAVQALVNEHVDGHENRRLLIWSLLTFDQWCEEYLAA